MFGPGHGRQSSNARCIQAVTWMSYRFATKISQRHHSPHRTHGVNHNGPRIQNSESGEGDGEVPLPRMRLVPYPGGRIGVMLPFLEERIARGGVHDVEYESRINEILS